MPPELRKRKAPAVEPATAPPAKKRGPVAKAVAKVKEVVAPKPKAEKAEPVKKNGAKAAAVKSAPTGKVAVGDTIDLEGFGGEIETNDGEKTTLKKLVEESESGVVLFTYPKASTPGCKSFNLLTRLHILTTPRHQASLSVPRLIRTSHCDWLCYLRSLEGLTKIKHNFQGKAEAAIPTTL